MPTDSAPLPPPRAVPAVGGADRPWVVRARRAVGAVRWYLRGITGADAYERYLEHHRRTHGDTAPMTEKEFWRERTDALERNPKSRCC